MANTNAPFGLRFIGLKGGGPQAAVNQERRNSILYSNATAIYTGDLLKMQSTGYLAQYSAGTAVSQVWGVFSGCRYYSNSQQTIFPNKYWPGTDAASGTVMCQYIPAAGSPTPLFVIQTDSTGITNADIGANADIVVGTGSTSTGFSGSYLDTGTLATTATLPLRIEDLWVNWASGGPVEGAGSSSTLLPGTQAGAYNWAVVSINVMNNTGI